MFDKDQNTLAAFCMFSSWMMGWLLIPSGIYFWRTGKSIFASVKPPYNRMRGPIHYPRRLKRDDFIVEVTEGPKVRQSGIRRLIAGILLLLLFIPLFVRYWQSAQNQEARILVILALAGLLPLLWYFGTPGEPDEGQGEGGGEEEETKHSEEGINSAEENPAHSNPEV